MTCSQSLVSAYFNGTMEPAHATICSGRLGEPSVPASRLVTVAIAPDDNQGHLLVAWSENEINYWETATDSFDLLKLSS